MVFHAQGDVVARLQTGVAQHIAELDCPFMQLSVGGDFSGLGLDNGGTVGMRSCVDAWIHASKLVNDVSHNRFGVSAVRKGLLPHRKVGTSRHLRGKS